MPITPLHQRLDSLPLVLAGPVVRRVEPRSVTVWIALRRAADVQLRVFSLPGAGASAVMAGTGRTVTMGEHLHLVAVTAVAPAGAPLQRGQIYGYDMGFDEPDGAAMGASLMDPGVVASDPDAARAALCYDGGPSRPSFVVPPGRVEALRIIHGSCRRPNRGGIDAMPTIDTLIAEAVSARDRRPQLLFLTGDNIYGDENDHPRAYLELIRDTARTLLGWREYLPGHGCHVRDLPLTARYDFPHRHMGHPEPALIQLFGLGEYLAVYLLVMSDVLWPDDFPHRGEAAAVAAMAAALHQVRRALANISTHAMFDDHDVSDDWNLNLLWCTRVYDKALGRRVVQNALSAFALVHAWGDRPSAFASGPGAEPAGARLLRLLSEWRPTGSSPEPTPGERELQRLLNIPESAAALHAHGEPPRLWHEPDAMDWHYQLAGDDYQILVLDLRTWRAFPGQTPLSLPDLLSTEALRAQLPEPGARAPLVTIVVSSIPVISQLQSRLERFWQYLKAWSFGAYGWARRRTTIAEKLSFGRDQGDVWSRRAGAFTSLLTSLARRRRVVVLSGDVHFAFAARLDIGIGTKRAVFAQLTSSGMLNESPTMRGWQRYGYNQPWPWYGRIRPVVDQEIGYRIDHLRVGLTDDEGREVVSNNNIGEVVFSTRDGIPVVIQRTWWRSELDGEMAPRTVFEVVLDIEP